MRIFLAFEGRAIFVAAQQLRLKSYKQPMVL
jgi:hypothetical protein